MFGHLKKKRESKRKKVAQFEKEKSDAITNARNEKKTEKRQKVEAVENAAKNKTERHAAREEGRADTEAFLSKEVQGMNPEKRQAMQYEANKQIQRGHQSANRQLLGEQASHGIVGKGGVGYAQQRDLSKMANEAKGAAHRDLTKLDADLALKKQAAIFAGGQGEATQQQIDKQTAIDELKYENERKKQREFENEARKQFSRL